jgi:H+-transporting ATPase
VFRLHLSADKLQTLAFVAVAVGSQATIYAIRDRRHVWSLAPSRWLLLSSSGDLVISVLLATLGLFMAALSLTVVGGIVAAAAIFGVLLALLKTPLFRHLKIS